jgi:hypothetical protein
VGFEFGVRIAQLTELRPARRSPNRRTKEDDDRLRARAIFVKANATSVYVWQFEIRQDVANFGARRMASR